MCEELPRCSDRISLSTVGGGHDQLLISLCKNWDELLLVEFT